MSKEEEAIKNGKADLKRKRTFKNENWINESKISMDTLNSRLDSGWKN